MQDKTTAAENVGKWHLGGEKGVKDYEETVRCEDPLESDLSHKQEAVASRGTVRRAATTDTTTATAATAREEPKMEMVEGVTRLVPD